MNEVAKMNGGEIVVADPFSPETYHAAGDVGAMIRSAASRVDERAAQMRELGDIETAPIEDVKELRRALEDDDAKLKDFDGDVKDALLKLSGFEAYIVQTRGAGHRIDPISLRGRIAAMVKELKAREDAEKPKEQALRWMVTFEATPSALLKIEATAKKSGAVKWTRMPLTNVKRIEAVAKVIKQIDADEAMASEAIGNVY